MLGAAAYFVTHLKLISRYVRESLSERLHGHLAWENRKISQITPDSEREGWLSPKAWNLLHPTRLAFEGITWLTRLTAALAAAARNWCNETPAWRPSSGSPCYGSSAYSALMSCTGRPAVLRALKKYRNSRLH